MLYLFVNKMESTMFSKFYLFYQSRFIAAFILPTTFTCKL